MLYRKIVLIFVKKNSASSWNKNFKQQVKIYKEKSINYNTLIINVRTDWNNISDFFHVLGYLFIHANNKTPCTYYHYLHLMRIYYRPLRSTAKWCPGQKKTVSFVAPLTTMVVNKRSVMSKHARGRVFQIRPVDLGLKSKFAAPPV